MLRIGKAVPCLLALFLVAGAVLLAGCTIKSGPREFPGQTEVKTTPAPEAGQTLAKSFTKTAADGKRFMYSGWAVTKIQKRNAGLYFTGGYDREKGYNMDARIFGQPFRYYRWGNDVYVSEEDKWRKASPSEKPLEPFADFEKLQFLADGAVRLPDGEVLGEKCSVYRITLEREEAFKAARAMGFENLQEDTVTDTFFDGLKMELTIFVGKDDNYIYQYNTVTTMPVPGAGSLYQEVSLRFWDYNGANVNLQTPDKLEPYLIK